MSHACNQKNVNFHPNLGISVSSIVFCKSFNGWTVISALLASSGSAFLKVFCNVLQAFKWSSHLPDNTLSAADFHETTFIQ
jgi:hypothetical protein